MKCKCYRQMHNFKSSVCDDSNIGAQFSLPLESSASKAAWRHRKGYSMGSYAQENLNLQKFLSQTASLICSVQKYLDMHTHTYFVLCYVLGSTASRLYCSLLIFTVRNWGGGKRQNRRRIQGSLSCSAPCPVQMHTSGSPYAGRGLQGGGGRGTPSTCPALTGLSPPQNAPARQRDLQWHSGSKVEVFNRYLKS